MLVHSPPGIGKTVFWGTGDKMLIADCDRGGSLAAVVQGSDCHVETVTDYDDLLTVKEKLVEDVLAERIKRNDPDLPAEFDWFVWDSLTLFQQATLIDDITYEAHINNPDKQHPFVPSKREYFIDHNRIAQLVREFIDLPINFGVSCHTMAGELPGMDDLVYIPDIQGKGMSSKISGFMNVIGYLGWTKKEVNGKEVRVRRMQWQHRGDYFAKDRFHALGTYMDEPTLPKAMRAIDARRAALREAAGKAPAARPAVKKAAARRPTRRG